MIKNPKLLKERLDSKEKQKEQSLIIKLSGLMFLIGFIKKMSLIFGAYTIISVFIPTYNRMIVNFLYNPQDSSFSRE